MHMMASTAAKSMGRASLVIQMMRKSTPIVMKVERRPLLTTILSRLTPVSSRMARVLTRKTAVVWSTSQSTPKRRSPIGAAMRTNRLATWSSAAIRSEMSNAGTTKSASESSERRRAVSMLSVSVWFCEFCGLGRRERREEAAKNWDSDLKFRPDSDSSSRFA